MMNTEERIMRCKIQGSWSAKEMAVSLMAFRDLYNVRLGLQIVAEDRRDLEEFFYDFYKSPPFRRYHKRRIHPMMLDSILSGFPVGGVDSDQLSRMVYPHEELKVRRIEYASPGFQDLAGFGEIVGHLKEFVLRIIEICCSRKSDNLKNEEQELKNQALRIQNAKEYVALARECGLDDSEVRKIVLSVDNKVDPIVSLAESGKIQNVRMLEDPESEEN